jgi:hypothetical protein
MTREERQEWKLDLDRLAANPAWVKFTDELRKIAEAEAEAHEDEKRSPQERAEHLHSMKILRELAGDGGRHPGWLEVQQARNTDALTGGKKNSSLH